MQLYKPDHNLPATRVLFDTTLLAARIRPWFGNGDFKLSISGIRYKPNTSCVVGYRIESVGATSFLHAKAFAPHDWQIRKQKFGRYGSDTWLDEEAAFAVFRFPCDAELPEVSKFVADPHAFLSRVLSQTWTHEVLSDYEILAYKPNRRLTAKLNFRSGKVFVLKIHDAATFASVLRAGEILKHAGFAQKTMRVGKSNRHRALVYQWIAGSTVDLSTCSTNQCAELLQSIYEYLDSLQVSFNGGGKSFSILEPAAGIAEIADYVGTIYPPMKTKAKRIGQSIQQNLQGSFRPTLIHGDFHERQLITMDRRISACDFDLCSLGDSTADLANLVGQLYFRAVSKEISRNVVDKIDETSFQRFGDARDPAIQSRYQWNRIAALFRLASTPFRRGLSNWTEQMEQVLNMVAAQIRSVKPESGKLPLPTKNRAIQPPKHQFESKTETGRAIGISKSEIENDSRLAFVAAALETNSAQSMFRKYVPEISAAYGAFEVSQIVVQRVKSGRRCLIEYGLDTDIGPRSILGKVSAKRLDQRTFNSQALLHHRYGFGYESTDGISVPRPIGICKPWQMWIQEKVAGQSGKSFLMGNRLATVAARIASALVKLQVCGFRAAQEHSIADELHILNDRLTRVSIELPNESNRILGILNNCLLLGNSIELTDATLIHRDFYLDQIMFSHDQTSLIDLDLISNGPPALDVGNLLAHLTEHGIRDFANAEHWAIEEQMIVDQYVNLLPHTRRRDIESFKAISLARHIAISWSKADRRAATSQLIVATEKLISETLLNLKQGVTT